MSWPLFLGGIALLLPGTASAWERTASQPLPAAPGLKIERESWTDASGSAELNVISFDAKTHRLRVFDQGAEGGASLAATLAPTAALAGINGGYFHPDRRPLGLVVADRAAIHPQERARLLSGMLVVAANGSMRLARPAEFRPVGNELDALQAGPFLVDRGIAVAGLEASRRAQRSIVLVDAQGRWSLVATSRLTLAEAAALLATRGAVRALNLDGGSSTALWARGPAPADPPAVALREFGTVRNFLGIVPRR